MRIEGDFPQMPDDFSVTTSQNILYGILKRSLVLS